MSKATIVEIFRGKKHDDDLDEFFFHAKARNGRVITQSEAYSRPWSAIRGARRAHPDAEIRDLTK